MDTQIDTAQRRAEALVDGLIEMTPGTTARLELIDRLILFEQQARRAALEEASKLVRARGDEYMNDCQAKDATGKKYRDTYEMRRVNSGRAWAFKDLADELDRLREGVERE